MSVDLERGDRPHVAHLTIDSDDLNLVTTDWIDELHAAADAVPDGASVVTIRAPDGDGDGVRGLTAGLNLDVAKDFSPHDGWDLLSGLYDAIQAVRDLDAVTVCSCGDYALGAGFELAIACDFRVATPDSALGLPEVDVGLPTVIHGGLLTRLVGLGTAKELIYTGRTISGEEARDLGIVHETAPPGEYHGTLDGLVDELASKSPLVLQWQKWVFKRWRSVGLEAGMEHSIGAVSRCCGTHDQREAMAAFLEDREPDFTGA